MTANEQRGRDQSGEMTSYRWVLFVLAGNATGFAFLETAILPALPVIQRALHSHSMTSTALLESAYLAAAAVASPLLGRLGDRQGKKGPLLLALGIYLFGAFNAGFSTSMWMLVPFRSIQGAGGAVLALSFAILRDRAPEGRIDTDIGIIIGAFGAGIAAGFGLSDVIATGLSWRWIFWFGTIVVTLNWVLVALVVPSCPENPEVHVDVWGAVLLALAIAALISAAAFGQPAGWGRWYIIELWVLAAVLAVLWVLYERRHESPLLQVRVLASPRVLLPNLGALFSGWAAFSLYMLVPRLVVVPTGLPPHVAARLHYGFGASPAEMGLYLLPVGVGVLIGAPAGGVIGRRWSGKWPFVTGLALLGVASLFLVLFHSHPIEILAWTFLAGLGFGSSVGASAAFVAEAVAPEQVGVATAFNTLMRLVGGGVGSQVAIAIYVSALVVGHGGPGSAASWSAFAAVFWISFGLSIAAAGLALLVPSKR